MYEGTPANKISELTREKAIMVIEEIDKVPSHYTRRDSQREYLPAGFHLTDLYKEFRKSLAEDEPTPSTNWFYTLLNTNYNMGTHRLLFLPKSTSLQNHQGGLKYSKFKAYVHSFVREEGEMDRPGKSKKIKMRLAEEYAKSDANLM